MGEEYQDEVLYSVQLKEFVRGSSEEEWTPRWHTITSEDGGSEDTYIDVPLCLCVHLGVDVPLELQIKHRPVEDFTSLR